MHEDMILKKKMHIMLHTCWTFYILPPSPQNTSNCVETVFVLNFDVSSPNELTLVECWTFDLLFCLCWFAPITRTVVSLGDGANNQESTKEQIFENIRLHKEVLQSVKMQPWSMRRKLRLVRQVRLTHYFTYYIPLHPYDTDFHLHIIDGFKI